MPAQTLATLDVRSRREWRRWLAAHHGTSPGVWLVFHKRHTGVTCLEYDDAVEEALCYGWIDSVLRRRDEARYVRKFTPRRRLYVGWVHSAKREETRARRLREVVRVLAAGRKLGMK